MEPAWPIGACQQDSVLFNDTVAVNISTKCKLSGSDGALKITQTTGITWSTDGIHTNIGDSGNKLKTVDKATVKHYKEPLLKMHILVAFWMGGE
jgi:ABC-type transport system involved in Fe-S cluster assembly fused permease/ATPase subunit